VIGQTISHYTIVGTLGRGGMGVVYKAEDPRLKRQVALKFLTDERPVDAKTLDRFRWEAQALSGLNHPNICVVYDIDEDGGRPFIVMELLDGHSLRDIVADGAMAPEPAIDVGIQIADALSAAHARDIIHRDLKPANIFLTARHQAKLLDFGLAKVVAESEHEQAMLAETFQVHTDPGFAMGTAGYMAPEQIRGERVDARTDIFALGAVLYELITGRPAFTGRTLGVVQDAVLNRPPEPVLGVRPGTPPRLAELIERCLEKDPDLRYQSAADVRADLRRLARDRTTPTGAQAWPSTVAAPIARRPRRGRIAVLAAATLAVAAIAAVGAWFLLGRARQPDAPSPRLVPFTSLPGLLRKPAFSPDGNQVAFCWNGGQGDSFSLYTQLFDAGSPLRLTTTAGEDDSPAWSPDGRFVAFLRRSADGAAYFVVPALGGTERRIRASYGVPFSFGRSIDWSPDVTELAIVDHEHRGGPLNILLVPLDGQDAHALLDHPTPYLQNPTFSPDGHTLAFVSGTGFLAQDIYVMTLPDGVPRRLTTDARHIAGMTWSADASHIIFSSNRGGLFAVWHVPIAGGDPQLVNAVGEDAYAPTLSGRSGSLAYLHMRVDLNIWRTPGPASEDPAQPPSRLIYSTREEWQPAFSPDDSHIAFVSSRSGSQEVWVATSAGADAVQLTSFHGPPTGTPRWSPDGKRLVFDSRVRGHSDIFIATSDGSGVRRLTDDVAEDLVPSWSRDGQWVYFTSDRAGRDQVWKVPADGGAPRIVLDVPARDIHESDDGTRLYYWRDGAIRSRPVSGATETNIADDPQYGNWLVRGATLYLLNDLRHPRPAIEAISLDTLKRSVVRELDDWPHVPFPPAFDLSHDQRWFVFGRVDQLQNDVMLVQNFR
jgi:Tol biopolymer transport system component